MWTKSALNPIYGMISGVPACPNCKDLCIKGKLALKYSFLLNYYFQIVGLKQICLLQIAGNKSIHIKLQINTCKRNQVWFKSQT